MNSESRKDEGLRVGQFLGQLCALSVVALFGLGNTAVAQAQGSCQVAYEWPDVITDQTIPEIVREYSTRVGSAIAHPRDLNPAQRAWQRARDSMLWAVVDEMSHLQGTSAPLSEKRDALAEVIRENLVDRTFSGGISNVFGHCGSGAFVFYAFAHLAGFSQIRDCVSAWGHQFVMVRDASRGVCLLDRWNLTSGPWDEAHMVCGENVAVSGGNVILPSGDQSNHRLYEHVYCQDYLVSEPPRITFSFDNWDREPQASELDRIEEWENQSASNDAVAREVEATMTQAHLDHEANRNQLFCE